MSSTARDLLATLFAALGRARSTFARPAFAIAVLSALFAGTAPAQQPAPRPLNSASVSTAGGFATMEIPDPLHQTGQNVTISLLTMGRGEQIWELFGHSAIWIHDNVTARDTVFNWGVFDSRQPNFILHFLKGLMLYQMGGETLDEVLDEYRYFNRTVWSQQLDLTTAEKDSLLHLIQINGQPENVQYRYDYFRDNCATRPRDLLDQITGGLLHANSMQVSDRTYRWHTLRLMQGNAALDVGVDIGLGEPADRPATRWDEMFLPKELHDVVASVQVHDSTGATHPLVVRETTLFQSTRPAEPVAPPNFGPWLLGIGLAVASLLAWIGLPTPRLSTVGRRIAAATALGLWSLVAGLLGTALAILWIFTDHVFAHANENLLLFNPLWLVLAVLVPVYYLTGRAAAMTRWLAIFLAAVASASLLAHVGGLSRQANLPIIGLALPAAIAIAFVLGRRRPAV